MTRKRRSNRSAQPTQPNHYVMVFAYWRIAHDRRTWWYRSLPLREVQKLIDRREVIQVEVETDDGPSIAYQERWTPGMSSDADNGRKIYRSPATLTLATMNAIAVSEPGVRLTRAEQAQVEKFTVWPLIGDTKAAAVRPRISDEQRRQAETLLGLDRKKPQRDEHRSRVGVLRSELPEAA